MTLIALRPTQQTVDIVASLRGEWHGSYAMCRCPAHNDCKPSLSLRQGKNGILVHCFAGCDAEDILREIARVKPLRGTPMPDFKEQRSSGNALRLWEEGRAVSGTLAEHYLNRRNLAPTLPDIRYHPRCPLGRKPDTRFLPALLIALREGGQIRAIQRIIINPQTHWHAGKYMLSRPQGACWRPSFTGSVLALAESFEDAAGFTALHGIPCWSAFGSERLPRITLPNTIDTLIIAEDNNAAGRKGAINAIKAHRRPGLSIVRRSPKPFEDWAAANEAQKPQDI